MTRLPQRPAHLSPERFWGLPCGEPIAGRLTVMRKMRSLEDEIEQRDQPAVVLVQRFTIRGMVPTMKGGTNNNVSDPTVAKPHVGVDEKRINSYQWTEKTGYIR